MLKSQIVKAKRLSSTFVTNEVLETITAVCKSFKVIGTTSYKLSYQFKENEFINRFNMYTLAKAKQFSKKIAKSEVREIISAFCKSIKVIGTRSCEMSHNLKDNEFINRFNKYTLAKANKFSKKIVKSEVREAFYTVCNSIKVIGKRSCEMSHLLQEKGYIKRLKIMITNWREISEFTKLQKESRNRCSGQNKHCTIGLLTFSVFYPQC
jgi:hypothetical protein